MKPKLLRLFLLTAAAEGIISLGAAAWLWGRAGIATTRLTAAGLMGLFTLALAVLAVKAFRQPDWLEAVGLRLQTWLAAPGRLLALAVTLAFLALLGGGILAALTSPAAFHYDTYAALFNNPAFIGRFEALRNLLAGVGPLLAALLLMLVEVAALLLVAFPTITRAEGFFQWGTLGKTLFLLALGAWTLFHWIILFFQLRVFTGVPGWYWAIYARPFTPSDLIFIVLVAALLAAAYLLLKGRVPVWVGLVALVILGYCFQVGFGFMEGEGFEYVRMKYAGTLHKSYALRASAPSADPIKIVRQYEQLYSGTLFPGTKPPGVMVFYTLWGKAVNVFDPQPNATGRFMAMTTVASRIFPLVSFLVLVALYFLTRQFIDARLAFLPSLLYLTAPNVILFPMFLDNVLYPLLFTGGVLLAAWAVRRGSFPLAVLTGVYLYLAVFASFSMLPLIPLVILLVALDYLLNRRAQPLARPARLVAGMALGVAVLFVLFWAALNYNFVDRYTHAMATVHYTDYVERAGSTRLAAAGERFSLRFSEIAGAAFLNNLDFGAAVGFPLFFLFLAHGIRTLVAWVRRKAGPREVLLGAYFLTYIALNLYGQNRGEAARLWMFWVPMVALFAALEVNALFRKKEPALVVLLLAQLVTLFLTFQFQDLWM